MKKVSAEKGPGCRRPIRLATGLWCVAFVLMAASVWAAPYRIGVLMLGNVRSEPVNGFKDGMRERGYNEGRGVVYEARNAGGNRSALAVMAREIVGSRPHLAVAAGGVESDALKAATAGTAIPVVFLAVASSVDRGLAASLQAPGGNLTGVDTDDTNLTAKRLWFLHRMFPKVRRVLVPSVPAITPAVKALEVARAEAPALNLEIVPFEGTDKDDIAASIKHIQPGDIDAIYIGMAAPVWQIQKETFYPLAMRLKIPLMGVNRSTIKRGAMAAYACSRYEAGRQAARLAEKILKGTPPARIPVETPEQLEFVINRWIVERMGVTLPRKIWRLADEVIDLPMD